MRLLPVVLLLLAACADPESPPVARVQAIPVTPTPLPTPLVATPAPTRAPATRAPTAVPRAVGSAIDPENRPTALAGRENGLLTEADLLRVEGECRAAVDAAPSLWRLLALARAQGVALHPGDCYRPRDEQAAARTRSCARGNCACAGVAGGSMHGWGKAVDFQNGSGKLGFGDPEYRWLKANAGALGWNHARWAEPGSACPEPWHWEWVGDGGRMGRPPIPAGAVAVLPSGAVVDGRPQDPAKRSVVVAAAGPHVLTSDGTSSCGDASLPRAVAIAVAREGCWIADASGKVVGVGGAPALGSASQTVVAMTATPTGAGYWLVTPRGDVLVFGDAKAFGSASQPAERPIVGIAASPTGGGYWLAASDGTVRRFGDAWDLGAPKLPTLAAAIASTATGYHLLAIDGTVATR